MHKTHTFLDGDALIELHEMLSDGYSHEQIGNKLNVHAQTVKNFDPANHKWRKDLFRIRTTSSKKFVTKGERKARNGCLLYTSPSPRDRQKSRMPSSA